ncbi:hypothetical protein B0H11DRAFT_2243343 [Mycena galericulata]|nr:hypothetical protein B0H11DRAFT_2243343 [Mycena galericulata]
MPIGLKHETVHELIDDGRGNRAQIKSLPLTSGQFLAIIRPPPVPPELRSLTGASRLALALLVLLRYLRSSSSIPDYLLVKPGPSVGPPVPPALAGPPALPVLHPRLASKRIVHDGRMNHRASYRDLRRRWCLSEVALPTMSTSSLDDDESCLGCKCQRARCAHIDSLDARTIPQICTVLRCHARLLEGPIFARTNEFLPQGARSVQHAGASTSSAIPCGRLHAASRTLVVEFLGEYQEEDRGIEYQEEDRGMKGDKVWMEKFLNVSHRISYFLPQATPRCLRIVSPNTDDSYEPEVRMFAVEERLRGAAVLVVFALGALRRHRGFLSALSDSSVPFTPREQQMIIVAASRSHPLTTERSLPPLPPPAPARFWKLRPPDFGNCTRARFYELRARPILRIARAAFGIARALPPAVRAAFRMAGGIRALCAPRPSNGARRFWNSARPFPPAARAFWNSARAFPPAARTFWNSERALPPAAALAAPAALRIARAPPLE